MVIILSFTFAINSFLQFIFIISRTTSLKNRTFGTFSLRKYLLNRHFVFMTETAHEKIFEEDFAEPSGAPFKGT